jgi:hypothetical protein
VIACGDEDIVILVRDKGPCAESIRSVCRGDRSDVPTPPTTLRDEIASDEKGFVPLEGELVPVVAGILPFGERSSPVGD